MTHNINNSRGNAFYSLREKAWHGLGTVVKEAQSSEEVIKLAKLDYIVKKARVFANYIPPGHTLGGLLPTGGYMIYDEHKKGYTIPKKGEIVPNAYVTYREDTHEMLMSGKVVTDRYTIVQNQEAFNWIDGLMDSSNIIFETAGALGRGERVFISVKLPNSYRIKGDDSEIEKYLLFTNTHDGSGRIQVLFTPVRVVCNNTLNVALQSNNKYQITHTKTVHSKLDMALDMLNVYNKYEKIHIEGMNHLTDIPVSDAYLQDIIANNILSSAELSLFYKNDKDYLGIDEISSKKKNKMSAIINTVYRGVGQNTNVNTAYWLVNGISNYYQNVKQYSSEEDRLDCILEGEGAKMINTITNNL